MILRRGTKDLLQETSISVQLPYTVNSLVRDLKSITYREDQGNSSADRLRAIQNRLLA